MCLYRVSESVVSVYSPYCISLENTSDFSLSQWLYYCLVWKRRLPDRAGPATRGHHDG